MKRVAELCDEGLVIFGASGDAEWSTIIEVRTTHTESRRDYDDILIDKVVSTGGRCIPVVLDTTAIRFSWSKREHWSCE